MTPSNQRSFLLSVFSKHHAEGAELTHWEFTREQEAALFEFIHPSVNTRDENFTLFNLRVVWDKSENVLVDVQGNRHPITTAQMDSQEAGFAALRAKFEREGRHPEAAAKAAEMVAQGINIGWSNGSPHEVSRWLY